jgi:hypothetical protein
MITGGSSFAFDHLTCSQFVALEPSKQVVFTKGLMGGIGATLGVLNSSVRAVKSATDPSQAKGAELAAAGVTKALSGTAGDSDEDFAKSIAGLCAQPEYASRPAASAAVDLLMHIKS